MFTLFHIEQNFTFNVSAQFEKGLLGDIFFVFLLDVTSRIYKTNYILNTLMHTDGALCSKGSLISTSKFFIPVYINNVITMEPEPVFLLSFFH